MGTRRHLDHDLIDERLVDNSDIQTTPNPNVTQKSQTLTTLTFATPTTHKRTESFLFVGAIMTNEEAKRFCDALHNRYVVKFHDLSTNVSIVYLNAPVSIPCMAEELLAYGHVTLETMGLWPVYVAHIKDWINYYPYLGKTKVEYNHNNVPGIILQELNINATWGLYMCDLRSDSINYVSVPFDLDIQEQEQE